MRAILIDPENKTLSEIQITDSNAEHRTILQCEDLYRGAVLSRNETGHDVIIVNNDPLSLDEPGFVLDGDHHLFVRCALAMRFDRKTEVVRDLQISTEKLAERITFPSRR